MPLAMRGSEEETSSDSEEEETDAALEASLPPPPPTPAPNPAGGRPRTAPVVVAHPPAPPTPDHPVPIVPPPVVSMDPTPETIVIQTPSYMEATRAAVMALATPPPPRPAEDELASSLRSAAGAASPVGAEPPDVAGVVERKDCIRKYAPCAGWKIGNATASPSDVYVRAGLAPLVAPVLRSAVVLAKKGRCRLPHPAAVFLDAGPDKECGVEAEWCFRLGCDLVAEGRSDIAPEWAAMAVQSIYPAVEVVANRVRGATFARIGDPEAPWPPPYVVAADLGLNHACVLGPPVFLCCDLLNTIPVALSVNGGKPCAAGKAGNAVMPPDGPLGALAWLANHLLARGDHLRKGDLVMSGATCGLTKVHPGDTVVASFDTTIQMGAVATVEVHMLAE
ncbi:hypothetical protein JL720_1017 [Aureococcus anophagefferens]|nr:hypothetical protein JL720_1017 [Aureococcus anophagefferens]